MYAMNLYITIPETWLELDFNAWAEKHFNKKN